MGRIRKHPARGKQQQRAQRPATARALQGIDQKHFVFNDIVPISIRNPGNSTKYRVIIQLDVNGYTVEVQNPPGTSIFTESGPYGQSTGQFPVQASMYTQYYMDNVKMELSLSQGGNVYSMTPIIQFVNPNGVIPFNLLGTDIRSLLSSPQVTDIVQPYSRHNRTLSYKNWLVANTDRAWRKTISETTLTLRELYPTEQTDNTGFTLPALVSAFEVTIPQATFGASAGDFLFGFFKTSASYCFSQRRTDINQLVSRAKGVMKDELIKNAKLGVLGALGAVEETPKIVDTNTVALAETQG